METGYAKLGLLMGEYPEVAIFRRYAALNAQNILYLQAELTHLEAKFRKYAREDESSNIEKRKDYSKDWYSLQRSASSTPGADDDSKQWRTFLEIRTKLKEYNEAIIQQKEMARLDHPSDRDLRFLQEWMRRDDLGAVDLIGQDSEIWSHPKLSDLLALKVREHEGPFSKWVSDKAVWWLHYTLRRNVQHDPESPHLENTAYYSESKLSIVSKAIATVLACLVPVLAITILYFLDSQPKRLGAIAALTALFSFSLVLLTKARIVDIFVATAAFAAVTVVYIGSPSLQRN